MPNFPKTPSSLLTACLLLSLCTSVAAANTMTKADQARPKPKIAAQRTSEAEKKGKRNTLAVKAVSTKSKATASKQVKGKAKNQDKQLTATRNQRHKPATKGATQLATKQSRDSRKTASAGHQPAAKQLASRLPGARLMPAAFVTNDRRGKFGKSTATATRDNNDATPANPPRKETARVVRQPDYDREPNRVEERPNADIDKPADWLSAPRAREVNSAEAPAYQIALPDKIEATEYGSSSPTLNKLLTVPDARPLTPFGAVVTRNGSQPGRRHDLAIPQQRVLEIQYELSRRGFYNAEPNGLYDETTVQAMWDFQKNYGLPATGYPTAHSLKRLGLTSW